MSRAKAIKDLFVAFGAVRAEEQAALYVQELTMASACGDCCEIAVEGLMRTSKRLPTLAQVLDAAHEVMRSEVHTAHIVNPQLAPRAETWWRTEAVKLVLPKVNDDRNMAAFIAAELWFNGTEATHEAVLDELEHPAWVRAAAVWLRGKDGAQMAEVAFRRARWVTEHSRDEEMPRELLWLGTGS